jgi:hypothetical protein
MSKPATASRTSSHPIYPRPVSPLQFEPVYNRPEDLLWEQVSESDGTEDVRAAKRRRIEKLGEAYLRGDGLFILSAGIRGPLEKGWRNPWAKKKSRKPRLARLGDTVQAGAREPVAEVPETVARAPKALMEKEEATNERRDANTAGHRSVQGDGKVEVATGSPNQDDPFIRAIERPNRDPTTERSNRNKWLKKNDVCLPSTRDIYTESREPRMSPSRRTRPLRPAARRATPPPDGDPPSMTGPTVAASSNGRTETAIKSLKRRQAGNVSPLRRRADGVAEAGKRGCPEVECSGAKDKNLEKHSQPLPCSVAENACENSAAEQTRNHSVSDVEQRLPSPPAEGSRAQESNLSDQRDLQPTKPTSDVPPANEQSGTRPSLLSRSGNIQHPSHPRQECEKISRNFHQTHRPMPPPDLSTETSSTTVASAMPSAQAAPTAQAPPPNESIPSTGDKLSEQHHSHSHHDEENTFHLSTQAAIAAANIQLQNGLTTPQMADAAAPKTSEGDASTSNSKPKYKSKSTSGITPFSAFNKPKGRSSIHNSLNTQEMLEAVTPFDTTTMAKKIPLIHPADSASPTIVAKKAVNRGQHKLRKKASFAPDTASTGSNSGSSQGSIKVCLKVRKHVTDGPVCAKEAKGISADYPGPSEFGKLGLDMETSDEDDERPPGKKGLSAERNSEAAVPKPASTSSTSKTSASEQDAQNRTPRPPPSVSNHHLLHQQDENCANHVGKKHVNGTAGFGGGDLEELQHGRDEDADAEADKNFDLSAAMDEVGSFLQSWDTEKEIKEMRRETKTTTKRSVRTGRER